MAYGVVMSALYMPIIVMLLALIFRGVAFEFREHSEDARGAWDAGFALGSLVATFAQGVTLERLSRACASRTGSMRASRSHG